MAEGWARKLMADRVEAYSAGTSPHGVNRLAIRSMAEAGVDISAQRSKHVNELLDVPLDLVVTVCGNAAENCPMFPGKAKVVHVGFEDPPKLASAAGAATDDDALPHYNRVRDQIRQFIEQFDQRIEAASGGKVNG
jgi:arsenate reductase